MGAIAVVCIVHGVACGAFTGTDEDAPAGDASCADGGCAEAGPESGSGAEGGGEAGEGGASDAGVVDAGSCAPGVPFGPSELLGTGDGGAASQPHLTPDETFLVFTHRVDFGDGGSSSVLLAASRASSAAGFDSVGKVVGLDALRAYQPMISPDALTLFFGTSSKNQYGDIWSANVVARTGTGGVGMTVIDAGPLVGVNSMDTDPTNSAYSGNPYLSANGLELFFDSSRAKKSGDQFPGGFGTDIYHAVRSAPAGPFSVMSRVDELATDVDDLAPVLTSDGLTLYFARDYDDGDPSRHAYTLYRAERAALNVPFGDAVEMPEVRGPLRSVVPGWISPDGCRLYFSADEGAGGATLRVASK